MPQNNVRGKRIVLKIIGLMMLVVLGYFGWKSFVIISKMVPTPAENTAPLVSEQTAHTNLIIDMLQTSPHFVPNDDGSAEVRYTPEEQKIRNDLVDIFAARYAAASPADSTSQSAHVSAENGIWLHAIGEKYLLITEANVKNGIDEVFNAQTGSTTPISTTKAVAFYLAPERNIAVYIEPQALYTYSLNDATATLVTNSELTGTETYDDGFYDGPGVQINPQETHTTTSITISIFDSSKTVPNTEVPGTTMYAKVGQKLLSF